MNEPDAEQRLRDALTREGQQARPSANAWNQVNERLGAPRRRPQLIVGAAAVVLAVIVGVGVALTVGRSDEQSMVVEPPPTTAATTTTTTHDTSTTTTTTAPERDVIVAPIDMGPTPPTRDSRPDSIVAVLEDGWLAEVDTATGSVIEQLEWSGDLRDDPDEGGPYGIWQVAVAADRSTIWRSFCCEPAAGSIRLTGRSDQPVLDADNPMVTMTSRWLTASSFFVHIRSTEPPGETRQHRIWNLDEVSGWSAAVLSPDGSRIIAEPWPERDQFRVTSRSPMHRVRTHTVHRTTHPDGSISDWIVDDEPVTFPSDRWTLPTFRRDGLLLVAEETDDGAWVPRLVDIDTFEVTDPGFRYGPGVPAMQRYDGSGEWLLVLMVDDPDTFPTIGRLDWFGPNGASGTIPGTYMSAAW